MAVEEAGKARVALPRTSPILLPTKGAANGDVIPVLQRRFF
jgi:hypothetical protein